MKQAHRAFQIAAEQLNLQQNSVEHSMKRTILSHIAIVLISASSAAEALPAADTDTVKSSLSDRISLSGNGEAAISFVRDHNSFNNKNIFADFSLEFGVDLGKGWSLTTEASFAHSDEFSEDGSPSVKTDEAKIEQLWIEKAFMPQLRLRAGWQEVPVGYANTYNDPDSFFGVFLPEAELATLPDGWKEAAVTLLGAAGDWSYQAMYLACSQGNGFAARVDNASVRNLRLGVSGYVGNIIRETLSHTETSGHTAALACFDMTYEPSDAIIRCWSEFQHQKRGNTVTVGGEAGYNLFGLIQRMKNRRQKLYVFGHYDYCRPTWSDYEDADFGRNHISFGFNYFPMKQLIVKGEYSLKMSGRRCANKPAFNLAVAYVADFL